MKIAIAGYGIEGKQSYAYYQALGEHTLTILDEREAIEDVPKGADVKLGPGAYDNLEQYDMVVRTAGLNPLKLQSAQKIWSATNEFFAQCPAQIIGVTGTKGKGTTSSFTANILREAGITTHLVGNIGVPALEVLPRIGADDMVVYELSSFQLWDIEASPNVAVVLMIEPDHLDVHSDFSEYMAAKAHIVQFQKADDICVYHPTNPYSRKIAEQHPYFISQSAAYNAADNKGTIPAVYIQDNMFVTTDGREICTTSAVRLPGVHNLDNACAALSACLPYVDDVQAMQRGLEAFTGLDHRLKFVAKRADAAYFDDSIATTPGSAIAAVQAFETPKLLILGGSHKGADFTELAQTIAGADMRHVLLIGEEAERIAGALQQQNVADYTVLRDVTMAEVVAEAAKRTQPGDVVILSPACASFGMFTNYQDRGDQFIAAVKALA